MKIIYLSAGYSNHVTVFVISAVVQLKCQVTNLLVYRTFVCSKIENKKNGSPFLFLRNEELKHSNLCIFGDKWLKQSRCHQQELFSEENI